MNRAVTTLYLVERDQRYKFYVVNDLAADPLIGVIEPALAKLEGLKAEWLAAQPLSAENERRLKQKLRLEWNYNSNHMEGNTLTYGETELLLIRGQTVGGHAIREYEEMKAHDVAVDHVEQLASDQRPIGEVDIRDLNKIILKEPFWKEAQTLDGTPTRKQVIPGEHKTLPNNVKTPTGDFFEFATPTETPGKMLKLVEWIREQLPKSGLHPIELAAKLHHEFLLIHPFDDGNGRVGRLLVNYVLLRCDFPPVIVKSADKAAYLRALHLADIGQLQALTGYLARQLEWSLDLGLRAARGESLEEPSDVEKEIAVFIHAQEADRTDVRKKSPEVLRQLYDSSWERLFLGFEAKMATLSPLFAETLVEVSPARTAQTKRDFRSAFIDVLTRRIPQAFTLKMQLQGYKSAIPFTLDVVLQLKFEEFRYVVASPGIAPITKLYSEPILTNEIDEFLRALLRHTFETMKVKAAGKQQ